MNVSIKRLDVGGNKHGIACWLEKGVRPKLKSPTRHHHDVTDGFFPPLFIESIIHKKII
jgi:hypothetical protein